METTLQQVCALRKELRPWLMRVFMSDSPNRIRWRSLTLCLVNIKEDGFIGGESGVSPTHLEKELQWLKGLQEERKAFTTI